MSLLNGGLIAWAREGHALERELRRPAPSGYQAHLASPEAGYVTGATLHVNGGMAML